MRHDSVRTRNYNMEKATTQGKRQLGRKEISNPPERVVPQRQE